MISIAACADATQRTTAAPPLLFDDVYRCHAGSVHRFCVSQVGDPALAEDLTHETFTRAFAAYERVRPEPATVRTWLLAIARNLATDHHRHRGCWRRLLLGMAASPAVRADVETLAEQRADLARVAAALATLGRRDWQLVGLRVAADLSYREIAGVMGTSSRSSRWRPSARSDGSAPAWRTSDDHRPHRDRAGAARPLRHPGTPARPPSWDRDRSPRGAVRAPRLPRRQHWTRRVAVTAAVAVAAGAVVTLTRHGATPGPAHPLPALTVSALPGAGTLSCRLPISALSADHTTGFIVLDHGHASFTPVHTSGTTYVPALQRWVDTLPQMVAPDGRSYVIQQFGDGMTSIHLIDAARDRTALNTTAPVNALAFIPDGILLEDMSPIAGEPIPSGTLHLELLDPATGTVRPFPHPLPSMGTGKAAGFSAEATYLRVGNAMWLTAYDPAADSATVGRYDMGSGATTPWFDGRTDGRGHVEVVGTDAQGRPIIQLAGTDLFHTDPAKRAGISAPAPRCASPWAALPAPRSSTSHADRGPPPLRWGVVASGGCASSCRAASLPGWSTPRRARCSWFRTEAEVDSFAATILLRTVPSGSSRARVDRRQCAPLLHVGGGRSALGATD
jgi:RNA polymerase sigma-70 factor (ECF subfamily)